MRLNNKRSLFRVIVYLLATVFYFSNSHVSPHSLPLRYFLLACACLIILWALIDAFRPKQDPPPTGNK